MYLHLMWRYFDYITCSSGTAEVSPWRLSSAYQPTPRQYASWPPYTDPISQTVNEVFYSNIKSLIDKPSTNTKKIFVDPAVFVLVSLAYSPAYNKI